MRIPEKYNSSLDTTQAIYKKAINRRKIRILCINFVVFSQTYFERISMMSAFTLIDISKKLFVNATNVILSQQ